MSVNPPNKNLFNVVRFSKLSNWSAASAVLSKSLYKECLRLEKIGNVIQRYKERIEVQDGVEYTRVTIRNKNRGVVPRDTVCGDDIGTKTQYKINAGQFIMSKIDARNGAFGIVPEVLEGAIVTQDFISFTIDTEQILPQFFVLITTSEQFMSLCQQASSGTTGRQRINESIFLDFEIPLPDLEVQRELVADYEEKIDLVKKCQNEIDLLEKLKPINIRKLTKIEIEKKETKKFFSIYKFKDIERWDTWTNNYVIHSSYPVYKLADLILDINTGTTPRTSCKEYFDGNINFYTPADLGQDKILVKSKRTITQKAFDDKQARVLKKNTLLFVGIGATVGKVGIVGNEIASSNQQITGIRVNSELIDVEYLYYYLDIFQEIAVSEQTKSTIPILNQEKIKDIPIVLVPKELQREIVEANKIADFKIKEATQQIIKLQKQAINNFNNAIFKN